MISDKIYAPLAEQAEKLGIFGHGYTYSAHPVCAAVALRAQKLMQERDIIGHVRSIMPTFAEHGASIIIKSYFSSTLKLVKSLFNIFALKFNLFKLDLRILILSLLLSFKVKFFFFDKSWKDLPPGAAHASKNIL